MDFKAVAEQLRKPDGEFGRQVGAKMNESNWYINQFTIDELDLKSNDSLLEIGMGNGFFVKDILTRSASVTYTGCDFSGTMIEESRQRNASFIAEGRATFILAATDQLPFPDETFDTVFSINTLYFWTDPARELAEIQRILKPGGALLLAIRPKSVMKNLPFTQYGFMLYEKNDVAELLEKNGYSQLKIIEKREPDHPNAVGEMVQMVTVIVRAEKPEKNV